MTRPRCSCASDSFAAPTAPRSGWKKPWRALVDGSKRTLKIFHLERLPAASPVYGKDAARQWQGPG